MSLSEFTRRRFMGALAGLGAGVAWLEHRLDARQPAPAAAPNRPLVVTSQTNELVREEITTTAWNILRAGGSALDAAEKATNVSERDPRDTTVGYGGDPNEDGFLQLDASVMNGADHNIGAVAALEHIKTPCSVARLVMERTDHWMLVGRGALRFARMHGFKEEDLLTDEARQHWLTWKETLSNRDYYLPPRDRSKPEGGGTINVLTMDAAGNIAGITSTVGHHFKIVGRVGDSPIIGAGLFVDNEVGAAGATGHGEECVRTAGSFLVVEKMREGMTPQQACRYVCERVMKRHNGRPLFNLKFVALDRQGRYGCCSLRGLAAAGPSPATGAGQSPAGSGAAAAFAGLGFAIHDARGHRVEPGDALLPPMTQAELDSIPWR
jgi:N4-(beta-N-acetylglucosaminyl)-L-asparaginase